MPPSSQRARRQTTRDAAPVIRFGAEPNKIDRRRYHAFKSGQSIKELADAESVQEKTIQFSIDRVRADNNRYSGEETAIQVRKLLLEHLPKAGNVLSEAMTATKQLTRQVVTIDVLTGNTVQLQESIREADHDTRLKAVSEYRGLISVVQPREPLITIDSRSQTNIMHGATPVTPNSLTSPEAVIRAIRAQRGLALADGTTTTAVIEGMVIAADDTKDVLDGGEDEDADDGEDCEEDEE